jgi:hypothetical protein
MENLTENLCSRDDILKILRDWADVGVFPMVVTRHDEKYGAGTLKFIYDDLTNIINIHGLLYQNFNYQGTLDNFLNLYKVWKA